MVVSGLILSNENYKGGTVLLAGIFGNPQVLISAHMGSLLKIRKVKDPNDTEKLRKVYSDI